MNKIGKSEVSKAESTRLTASTPSETPPSIAMTPEDERDNRSDNWIHVEQPSGLKVIIVGGGVGGLTAAIVLRKQGHHVEIYESSGFSKEVGAALHTAPNGNAILKRLGISCRDIGANPTEYISEWTHTGTKVKQVNIVANMKIYEHKWRMAHRIKLHEELRKVATEEAGIGHPAKLILSKAVNDVDTKNAIVYFKDGTSVQGDVVVGADGVHSITRTKLPGGEVKPFASGQSAFRFMIPRATVLADSATKKFAENDGDLVGIFGPDRCMIIYPTSDNTVLNFACMHPDSIEGSTGSWGFTATIEQMLEVYKDFHPDMLTLLKKAEEGSLKVWKLLDMEKLPTWHHERLAVIGDAAHPFLPFLGQGGAIAIEDAVSLGILLEKGLSRDEVPERLELYQHVRKERAELVQEYTRLSGRNRGEKTSFDIAKYQNYCFAHNEWDNTTQMLREWKWARSGLQHMTTVFGPTPESQLPYPKRSASDVAVAYVTAAIRFSTSRTVVKGFLPPGNKSFRFGSPGSIAQCTFRQTTVRGLFPPTGRVLSQLSLHVHGVEYTDEDGTVMSGAFVPVIFESMPDTVAAGQKSGIPKIWSTMDVERDSSSFHIRTSWEGLTWGTFYLDDLKLITSPGVNVGGSLSSAPGDEATIICKYGVGQDSSAVTIYKAPDTPPATESSAKGGARPASSATVDRVWRSSSAHFQLHARDGDVFPTIHHIISRLQEMPIHEVIEATVVEGSGCPDFVKEISA